MNFIANANYEDSPAKPVALGDNMDECRMLAHEWLTLMDPNTEACPVSITYFTRGMFGFYQLVEEETL
jgi:hypothetical protein